MASLRLYGAHSASTERMLASQGATVELGTTPDLKILQRAINHDQLQRVIDLNESGLANDPTGLAELLSNHPEKLCEPLVVRGNSFMVSRDPARLQSLMY